MSISSNSGDVILAAAGDVFTVTLNRPTKLNAINAVIEGGLREALDRFEEDDGLRVMLINAVGPYFSTGFDIGHRVDDAQPDSGIALRRRYRQVHDLFDRIERVEKPVVLAAHGPCLGGALELALSCDFRLASTNARFALPEIAMGVMPGSGGTSRTTRIVGAGWARWLVMAGRPVDAARALQIGLVHDVHPPETFDDEVQRFVEALVALPREAVALAKLTIDLCDVTDRGSGRDVERIANTMLMQSEDHRNRVELVKEKISRRDR